MNIYPLPSEAEIISQTEESGNYIISPGRIQIFEFDLKILSSVTFTYYQTARRQDNSIRAWFSKRPCDLSINNSDPQIRWFHFRRIGATITLKEKRLLTPDDDPDFFYPAGTYFINIQNIENATNSYYLKIS